MPRQAQMQTFDVTFRGREDHIIDVIRIYTESSAEAAIRRARGYFAEAHELHKIRRIEVSAVTDADAS